MLMRLLAGWSCISCRDASIKAEASKASDASELKLSALQGRHNHFMAVLMALRTLESSVRSLASASFVSFHVSCTVLAARELCTS
jgi:hypothetical protein